MWSWGGSQRTIRLVILINNKYECQQGWHDSNIRLAYYQSILAIGQTGTLLTCTPASLPGWQNRLIGQANELPLFIGQANPNMMLKRALSDCDSSGKLCTGQGRCDSWVLLIYTSLVADSGVHSVMFATCKIYPFGCALWSQQTCKLSEVDENIAFMSLLLWYIRSAAVWFVISS